MHKLKTMTKSGFTLIELLVVISIIGMLAGMLIPAVQNAREAGRRATCINNQRNVAIALINYMETKKKLPMGRNLVPIPENNASTARYFGSQYQLGQPVTHVGWQVMILPFMESTQIWDNLTSASDSTTTESVRKPANVKLPFYWCPTAGRQEDGQVSYTVNAGYNDMPWGVRRYGAANDSAINTYFQDGEESVDKPKLIVGETNKFNGLFLDGKDPNYGQPLGIEDIKDGATNTMMVSENLQFNEIWAVTEEHYGFCWPYFVRNDSNWRFLDVFTCIQLAEAIPYIPPETASKRSDFERSHPVKNPPSGRSGYGYQNTPMRINRCALDIEGSRAWLTARPSSAHPGCVVVAFADGSARIVREDLDNLLYISAMAPDDRKCECSDLLNKLFLISDLD